MRIVIYGRHKSGKGGVATAIREVADGLDTQGHDIHCLRLDPDLKPGQWEERDGTTYLNLAPVRTWKKIPRPSSVVRFAISLLNLRRLLREIQPQIVNSHYLEPRLLHFAILKAELNYRLVVTCHGSDVVHMTPSTKAILPLLERQTDHIVCVSNFLSSKLKSCLLKGAPMSVIGNGIDPSFWRRFRSPSKKPIVLSVGSLKRVKGHDVLIRAFSEVKESIPEARLVIIGDGGEKDALRCLSQKLDIEDDVCLRGRRSPDEIREALQESAVFAFPSRSEGFGIALLEAMFMGVPPVASRIGAIPELIANGSGTMVEPGNVSALAGALINLLEDHSLRARMGKKARYAVRSHTWDHVISQYERLFQELCNET